MQDSHPVLPSPKDDDGSVENFRGRATLRITSQPAGGKNGFAFFLPRCFFFVQVLVSFSGDGGIDLLFCVVRCEARPPRRDTRPRKVELSLASVGPPTIFMVGSGAGGSVFASVFCTAGLRFFWAPAGAACGSDMTDCWLECAGGLVSGRCRLVGMRLMPVRG